MASIPLSPFAYQYNIFQRNTQAMEFEFFHPPLAAKPKPIVERAEGASAADISVGSEGPPAENDKFYPENCRIIGNLGH